MEHAGKRRYLPGAHGSPESIDAYRSFIHEVCGASVPAAVQEHVGSVAIVIDQFLSWAEVYYPDPRGTYLNLKTAMLPLVPKYGALHPTEFGPKKLKEWQAILANSGKARSYVNDTTRRIKQCFRWAVSEELIPASVSHALDTVAALKQGRTKARESSPRRMVAWKNIRPVLRFVPRWIRTMILLHWLTGCRSRSLCLLKPGQIDRTITPWEWTPRHKMEFSGQSLTIYLGPKARKILRPLLDSLPPDGYVFSPRSARKNKRYGRFYSSKSYRQAVERGINRANEAREKRGLPAIERWTPHRIRHSKGTLVRAAHGLEAAQALLGHGDIQASQIYAARRLSDAKRIAESEG